MAELVLIDLGSDGRSSVEVVGRIFFSHYVSVLYQNVRDRIITYSQHFFWNKGYTRDKQMTYMNRRSCLVAAGSVGSALLAGCLETDDEEETYAIVQYISVLNELDESRTMELRIERDETNEVVHDEAYELEASQGVGGGRGLEVGCVWPDEPLQLFVRASDEDEYSNLSTDEYPSGCLEVLPTIRESGTTIMVVNEDCPVPNAQCHADNND